MYMYIPVYTKLLILLRNWFKLIQLHVRVNGLIFTCKQLVRIVIHILMWIAMGCVYLNRDQACIMYHILYGSTFDRNKIQEVNWQRKTEQVSWC